MVYNYIKIKLKSIRQFLKEQEEFLNMFKIQKNKINKEITSVFLAVCLMFGICLAIIIGSPIRVNANEEDILEDNTEEVRKIEAEIDYINEVIILKNIISTNGEPVYMYSPKASITANAKKQASEKWFEVRGNTIDISKYIPSKAGKESVIAVRFADDIRREDKTYESRAAFIISSRPNISLAMLKEQVIYDMKDEHIKLIGDLKDREYDYSITGNGWNYRMTGDLDVSPKVMPLGGSVTIRLSATDESFSSNSIKIKVPKPIATPKLKVNLKKFQITGTSNKLGWSVSIDGEYKNFDEKKIDFKDFENKLTKVDDFEITTLDGIEYIKLYVKVLPTHKRPSSMVQTLLIPLIELKSELELELE